MSVSSKPRMRRRQLEIARGRSLQNVGDEHVRTGRLLLREVRGLAADPQLAREHEAGGRDQRDDDGDDPSGKEKSAGGGHAEIFRIVFLSQA